MARQRKREWGSLPLESPLNRVFRESVRRSGAERCLSGRVSVLGPHWAAVASAMGKGWQGEWD